MAEPRQVGEMDVRERVARKLFGAGLSQCLAEELALSIHGLYARVATRMPAELERARYALKDCGIGGIYDDFGDSPAYALEQMAKYIRENDAEWKARREAEAGEPRP